MRMRLKEERYVCRYVCIIVSVFYEVDGFAVVCEKEVVVHFVWRSVVRIG